MDYYCSRCQEYLGHGSYGARFSHSYDDCIERLGLRIRRLELLLSDRVNGINRSDVDPSIISYKDRDKT
jgi:hypothetical protein